MERTILFEISRPTNKPLVVCLGQASLDLLGQAPYWPEPDSKCQLDGLTIQGGGPAATAAVTISRLGLMSALIAAIGDDWFGRLIKEGLIQEGVDLTG
ncbi:MAG: carbohydrate kinase, partial [Deltaproteobacteria bacterium]|nr:carbohydrate kinase [Deltaproteobacteria bacterium]